MRDSTPGKSYEFNKPPPKSDYSSNYLTPGAQRDDRRRNEDPADEKLATINKLVQKMNED